jgi:DNA repair photolyase
MVDMLRRVWNPPNPWESTHVEWLGEPPPVELQVYEEHSRSILAENDSPDVPFRWSVNPYRGCQHACAYCYARTTHQYLGFGAGTDFDARLVAKVDAPELLREAFARRSWRGEEVVFSGVTDPYQPIEATYELTRRCLEVCREFANPVGIVTKSALVRRDAELLASLARRADVKVYLSIPFADEEMARRIEPWAASPAKRLETLRVLAEAGLATGVAVAPLIPGLNDAQVAAILASARAAGARSAFMLLLRLPGEVRSVFLERLAAAYPDRVAKVVHALEELRAAQASPGAFGQRMRGAGPRWEALRGLFEMQCRRLGLEHGERPGADALRREAHAWRQEELF